MFKTRVSPPKHTLYSRALNVQLSMAQIRMIPRNINPASRLAVQPHHVSLAPWQQGRNAVPCEVTAAGSLWACG